MYVSVTFVWLELLRWPKNFACLLGYSWIAVRGLVARSLSFDLISRQPQHSSAAQ